MGVCTGSGYSSTIMCALDSAGAEFDEMLAIRGTPLSIDFRVAPILLTPG